MSTTTIRTEEESRARQRLRSWLSLYDERGRLMALWYESGSISPEGRRRLAEINQAIVGLERGGWA